MREIELKARQMLGSSLRVSAITCIALAATGCSFFNIGEKDYGCSGLPQGVQCMSARDVYALTNDGNVLGHTTPEKAATSAASVTHGATLNGSIASTYIAPRLPDQPVPIRTPAQVMRIWVAPWENTSGDLITTGYVYTEIEPRRWLIGEQAPDTNPVLRPLQVTNEN